MNFRSIFLSESQREVQDMLLKIYKIFLSSKQNIVFLKTLSAIYYRAE